MSNKLSAESWDEVLNRLDTMENSMKNALTDPSIVMPKWMVAAFNLSSCPDWWKSYDDAKWRFVIGVWSNWTATYSLWAKWWNSNSTLNVSNLPPHNHNIFIEYRWDDSDHDPWDVVWIWHHKADGYSTSLTAYWYTEDTWNGSNGNMKGTSFSVLNPYVALLYCEKL